MTHQRDQVFRDPQNQLVDFVFDESVVAVFPDMIRRSIPGYETLIPLTGLLAARHLNPGDRCWDLGCSLGATTLAVLRGLGQTSCRITGVDSSAAMVREVITLQQQGTFASESNSQVEFVEQDILSLGDELQGAKVVLLNFVLQFLPLASRQAVLSNIRRQLDPEGVLILSEKITFSDDDLGDYYNAAHLDYKRANGYSELEVSQKRNALENVMIIDTEEQHLQRFETAGFDRCDKWFQCMNWASFLVRP